MERIKNERLDVFEIKHQHLLNHKNLKLGKKYEINTQYDHCFDVFVGYWQLDTIEDFDHLTLIQLYRDIEGCPRAKFYDGTQNNIREVNINDELTTQNPVSPAGNDIPVEMVGPKSLRFINYSTYLSTDDLTSTMRIQDDSDDVAFCQFFTDWDGSADNKDYGIVENLSKFLRLPDRPYIQMNNLPSPTDWTNPVNIMKYVNDFYNLLGQPQKAYILQQKNYIGWAQAENLLNTFLTTGVKRHAQVSGKKIVDKYIGVWKTQFPEKYPITTIHTEKFHHMNSASTVVIKGFKKEFKVLNGVHTVSGLPCSVSLPPPNPWQLEESTEHYIHINFDSSKIDVDYDPCRHGRACIKAQHGPVTPGTEYRDFAAALFDFNVSVWGPGTHTRIRFWLNETFNVVNTFSELKAGIADDSLFLLTNNFRTYVDNISAKIYHNPVLVAGNIRFPVVNINDPYHLGDMEYNNYYDYDIDLQNYLDKHKAYNLFFAVTGPTVPSEPITELLVDNGYPNNGSIVKFTVSKFGVFPDPLVDEYGVHNWLLFGAADSDPENIEVQKHRNYLHGIINKKYTCGKTVGYIRIQDCDSFDSPTLYLTTRSLAFGRSDMPTNRIRSNYIAGVAAVIENLNRFNPDRIILDIRDNGGGFSHIPSSIASLFGGNRVAGHSDLAFAGNGFRNPLEINENIQSVFDSIQQNTETENLINVDAVADIFPNGVFRGNPLNPKELIILTNTHAASAGDMIPHYFIGSDPNTTVHDLGNNVTARIIGDIDGKLWSGIKSYDGIALDPLNYNLSFEGEPRTCVYLSCEAGVLVYDKLGTLVNVQDWTKPNVLLPTWYNNTVWQDLGLIAPQTKYLLKKPLPDYNDKSTWRDVMLEYAIKK